MITVSEARNRDLFWKFTHERQKAFYSRFNGEDKPWCADPIINKHKFTNVFRSADRVSQYLINHVQKKGPQDPKNLFFRTILFKIFNKIETWEEFEKKFGVVEYSTYDEVAYHEVCMSMKARKVSPYLGAYLILRSHADYNHLPSSIMRHLALIRDMMEINAWETVQNRTSLKSVYEYLRCFPFIGVFLSYQFTIDLNYSDLINFSENDFTIPGPGAREGAKLCGYGDKVKDIQDAIHHIVRNQVELSEQSGFPPVTLFGRPLHAIDVQNLFCEVYKYLRYQGYAEPRRSESRGHRDWTFKPKTTPIKFGFPDKWGIVVPEPPYYG